MACLMSSAADNMYNLEISLDAYFFINGLLYMNAT